MGVSSSSPGAESRLSTRMDTRQPMQRPILSTRNVPSPIGHALCSRSAWLLFFLSFRERLSDKLCLLAEQLPRFRVWIYHVAVMLDASNYVALNNLGDTLYQSGDESRAIAYFRRAIRFESSIPEPHYNLAIALLALGYSREGFQEYEWRKSLAEFSPPRLPGEEWNGVTRAKRILIYGEQGLGDCLQFLRFLPNLADYFGETFLFVQPPLASIVNTVESVHTVLTYGDELPSYDYRCSLLSLPAALRLGGSTRFEA